MFGTDLRNVIYVIYFFLCWMKATLQSTYLVAHEPDDDNILRTRTYDVSIT